MVLPSWQPTNRSYGVLGQDCPLDNVWYLQPRAVVREREDREDAVGAFFAGRVDMAVLLHCSLSSLPYLQLDNNNLSKGELGHHF